MFIDLKHFFFDENDFYWLLQLMNSQDYHELYVTFFDSRCRVSQLIFISINRFTIAYSNVEHQVNKFHALTYIGEF